MLWLPPLGYREVQTNLPATPSSSIGPAFTGGSSAHTKGSWEEVIASTTYETEWVVAMILNTSVAATQTDTLVDIGVGAASSEQVLIPDLLGGWSPNGDGGIPRVFSAPIYIPKGTRISARAQSITTSKSYNLALWLYGGARNPSLPTFSKVDAIGVTSSGASQGTSVIAGATAGTEGSWTSVGSTTARAYKGLYFLVQGTLADTTSVGNAYHWEVGYSDTALAEFFSVQTTSERTGGPVPAMPIFHPIPSGTQLQVRCECSSNNEEAHDVALYGLY